MSITELVRAALLQYAEEKLDWASFSAYLNYYDIKDKVYNVPGLGPIRIVDYHSEDMDKNYDGWAEDIWVVFDIDGVLYKATGTYTSYVGPEWQRDLKIVQPKQVEITIYEEVE